MGTLTAGCTECVPLGCHRRCQPGREALVSPLGAGSPGKLPKPQPSGLAPALGWLSPRGTGRTPLSGPALALHPWHGLLVWARVPGVLTAVCAEIAPFTLKQHDFVVVVVDREAASCR